MYRANKKHLQPLLISNVNELPEKHRQRLEQSWADTFYRETFCRIPEDLFRVLYADLPSRPNVPVNVLVSLDLLKAQFGWSDEELYDHFIFDLQVRYALGLRDLKEGDFDLRTLYYFRHKLAQHYLEQGENLLTQAFEQMTDQQALVHRVNLHVQRMDSTQIMSHMVDASRLQLLVEALQRLARILCPADQARYAELLAPYLQTSAHQFIYPIKGPEAWQACLTEIGQVMGRLVSELAADYAQEPIYRVFQHIFTDNYRVEAQTVQARPNAQIPSGCLQSVDDLEASYRKKGPKGYKGYVANLAESCTPENDLQLITQVQVAPNNREDADLLAESLPDLKARTGVESLYVDGSYGSPAVDQACIEQQVELVPTGIRGAAPDPNKLNLADFEIERDAKGRPRQMACPGGQRVPVEAGRTTGYLAHFEPGICQVCPFFQEKRCRVQIGKRDPHPKLSFTQAEVNWAKRRRRHAAFQKEDGNLRAAVEATLRSLKHAFPNGKLPVRGLFRVTCLLVASAAMINVRRIHRFLREPDPPAGTKTEGRGAARDASPVAGTSAAASFTERWKVIWTLPGLRRPAFGF